MSRVWLGLGVALLCFGCTDDPTEHESPAVDPIGHSTPEAQGFESERLRALVEQIASQDLDIHGFMILRHGQIVLDAKFFPYDGTRAHDIASCTKSLTSTGLGLALRAGEIESLDQKLLSFFPELTVQNDDENKRAITLANAVSMTSGFDCVNEPTEVTLIQMQSSTDWVGYALDVPMAGPPGQSWRYCGTATHALSGVISRASGQPLDQLLIARLFEPLFADTPIWPRDPQGVSHGWGDARLSAEAMARVGQLFLERGTFGGRSVLDAAFVDEATSNRVGDLGPPSGYGHAWWVASSGGYYASGRGGQKLFVLPALDAVIVTTGGAGPEQEQAFAQLLNAELADGLSDTALEPDPDAVARLQETVASVALPPVAKPVPTPPALESSVSGTRYQLESNLLGWSDVSITFGSAEATLSAHMGTNEAVAKIGLDSVPRITRGIRFAEPDRYHDIDVALAGRWLDASTFEVSFATIDTIDAGTLRFSLHATGVTIVLYEKTFIRAEIVIEGSL